MFFWTRNKIIKQVSERLGDSIQMAEALLMEPLPPKFAADRYIIGYLAGTSILLATDILKKPMTPRDSAIIAFVCVKNAMKGISPKFEAFSDREIFQDKQYKSGITASQIIMCEINEFDDFEDEHIVIEARRLANETGEPPVTFLMQHFFFGYIRDKYSEQ